MQVPSGTIQTIYFYYYYYYLLLLKFDLLEKIKQMYMDVSSFVHGLISISQHGELFKFKYNVLIERTR